MTIDTETHLTPRRPALDRAIAMQLAAGEYTRFLHELQRLSAGDWARPTDCPGWDVRAMAGHVVGMAEMAASLRETMRQMAAAKKRGGVLVDALTAVQVEKEAHLEPAGLIELFARVGPKAARARKRVPALVRNRTMPDKQQVGVRSESWTVGFLFDVILTRDVWMHRIDISRATGTPMELTPEHDGLIVADVVDEWAGRHGDPFALELTGPAGGTWSGPGEPVVADALDFCRALAGRGSVDGIRDTVVPF